MRYLRWIAIVLAVLIAGPPALAQYWSEEESQDCIDARDEAQSSAGDLSWAAQRLQQCADSEDFDDDCSAEFYHVQNAHIDYESAAGDVSYACE